ncbi:hypothetical protein CISECK367B_22160 [Citrobacter sedlakii]
MFGFVVRRQRITHTGSGESVDKYRGGTCCNNGFVITIMLSSLI